MVSATPPRSGMHRVRSTTSLLRDAAIAAAAAAAAEAAEMAAAAAATAHECDVAVINRCVSAPNSTPRSTTSLTTPDSSHTDSDVSPTANRRHTDSDVARTLKHKGKTQLFCFVYA